MNQMPRVRHFLSAVVLTLLCLPAAAFGQQAERLVVLPLEGVGVDQKIADNLTELLTIEIDRANLYEVMSRKDLEAQLQMEGIKQMMGEESEQRLADIGKQLNAPYILRGTVGRVGNTYVIALALIDVNAVKTVRRVNQTLVGAPDGLLGSIKTAALAIALEEKGVAPDITEGLLSDLEVATRPKTMFFNLRLGYEIPVGPSKDSSGLGYFMPQLMTVTAEAAYSLTQSIQLMLSTGVGFSILQEFQNQNKSLSFTGTPGNLSSNGKLIADTQTIQVIDTAVPFSTLRVPVDLMVRFQPATGRFLPYAALGVGVSWQMYNFGDEKMDIVYDHYTRQNVTPTSSKLVQDDCAAPYSTDSYGHCSRSTTLLADPSSRNYFNLDVPAAAGLTYLITRNIAFTAEFKYLLTFSFKGERDLDGLFISDKDDPAMKYDPDGAGPSGEIIEQIGDTVPIRQLHHGISINAGMSFYF